MGGKSRRRGLSPSQKFLGFINGIWLIQGVICTNFVYIHTSNFIGYESQNRSLRGNALP